MSEERVEISGAQQCTIYPFAQWKGKKHEYALTVDVGDGLLDVTKPQAKVNIVVDKKIAKTITIQEMIQGFFNL